MNNNEHDNKLEQHPFRSENAIGKEAFDPIRHGRSSLLSMRLAEGLIRRYWIRAVAGMC